MISQEQLIECQHMGKLYSQLIEILKPYNDKYEFIHKYETSENPVAIEYRECRKKWLIVADSVIRETIKEMRPVEECKKCHGDIKGSFYVSNNMTSYCMKCYCEHLGEYGETT